MSFEPVFVVGVLQDPSFLFLLPSPASSSLHNVFTTATTPPVCALVHRLGLRPRVLQPANYSRHVQIITTFLAPFSLRQERIRRGIEDWIECPRRGILGTRPIPAPLICNSPSLSHAHSGLEHFRCIYARMHRPIHRHSDRSRSLYRINYNVHGSRTRIAIRSIRVPEGVLFNYIYTARGNGNGREINVRGIPGTTGSGCSRASIRGSRF